MIRCPRCKSNECIELYRNNDNIDALDHSHIRCNICKYEFNHWNESEERLRKVFGERYEDYCVKTMWSL